MLTLLIAIAIGTVILACILAIGREQLPGSTSRLALPRPARLPDPERLRPAPDIGRTASAASTSQLRPARRVTVPVQLTGVPTWLRNDDAGVATFQSETGSDFRWFPLSEALSSQEGSLLITADAESGARLTLTFAAQRAHARHGYLSRRQIEVTAPNGRSTPIVALSGEATEVGFELPTDADHAGPLRLQRVDDRQWLPMLHGTSGLTLTKGELLSLWLAAGAYELQDPLDPMRSQTFEVPATAVVVVSPALAPARADRQ